MTEEGLAELEACLEHYHGAPAQFLALVRMAVAEIRDLWRKQAWHTFAKTFHYYTAEVPLDRCGSGLGAVPVDRLTPEAQAGVDAFNARAEALARKFHETYEGFAPSFGYETRRESAKPWSEVPEQNKALMFAVCAEILSWQGGQR